MDGSQITNLNPSNITGSGNLNIGNGDLFVDDASGNVGIGTTSPSYKLDVFGDIGLNSVSPPGAFSTSINTSAGNLNGIYVYRATFVTQNGETDVGELSDSVSPVDQQVTISNLPISPDSSVIARKIYRSDGVTGGGWTYKLRLVDTILDNTTTSYIDNVSSQSLGAYIPGINTTGGNIKLNGEMPFIATNQTVSLGHNALMNNNGFYNSAIGTNSLKNNTYGYYNSAIGGFALENNVSGYYNVAMGVYALQSNTTGFSNVAIGGQRTMESNVSGIQNIAIGDQALQQNVTGGQNTAVGLGSLRSNISGGSNVAIGNTSLESNVSGIQNIAIGSLALQQNVTGGQNTAVGLGSLRSNISGDSNIAIGNSSLVSNTTGIKNIAIGAGALEKSVDKNFNIAIGQGALKTLNGGYNNMSLGYNSLYSATTGSSNVSVGLGSLYGVTTSLGNVAMGENAGGKIVTGNMNVFIGYGSGNNALQVPSASNSISIGNGTYTTQDNQIIIGNTSNTQTLLNGNVGIGITDPKTKLEVDGIIKTKERSSATCNADAKGGIYFDSDDNHFFGCNGTAWVQLDN